MMTPFMWGSPQAMPGQLCFLLLSAIFLLLGGVFFTLLFFDHLIFDHFLFIFHKTSTLLVIL